jgi:hypothetical protein
MVVYCAGRRAILSRPCTAFGDRSAKQCAAPEGRSIVKERTPLAEPINASATSKEVRVRITFLEADTMLGLLCLCMQCDSVV